MKVLEIVFDVVSVLLFITFVGVIDILIYQKRVEKDYKKKPQDKWKKYYWVDGKWVEDDEETH